MTTVNVVTAAVMLIGLFGTILPIVPGLIVIWLTGLVYALTQGLNGGGGAVWFVVFTLLAIAGFAASLLLPTRGAARAGAGGLSIGIGVLGAVIGFFAIPVIGIVVGGVIGVYLGEMMIQESHKQAVDATMATLKGFGWGILVEFLAGSSMIFSWVVWRIVG